MTEPDFEHATRTAYDTVAADYAAWLRDELAVKPLDRAILAGFADLVRAAPATGPVADVGCGAGRITAHLHGLDLPVLGIDLSPRMVAEARRAHPNLRFEVGSMLALDLPEGAVSGLVAWYSIIHLPPARLPDVLAEFHRVLAPGGHLLVAFQVGDEPRHLTTSFGRPISLDSHRLRPERITDHLTQAGLPVHAHLLREPDTDGTFTEQTPQAFLLARKA